MGMIPARPSRIFRSRWWALLWAGGVIWTAVSFVGFSHSKPDTKPGSTESVLTDDSGAEVSNADLAVLRNYLAD